MGARRSERGDAVAPEVAVNATVHSESSEVQAVLDALASPVRREILWRVWDDEVAAGAIVETFHLSGPTISGHLAVLRRAGLVTVSSEGTFRRYRANKEALRGLHHLVALGVTKWEPADGIPETQLATARTAASVVATVEVPVTVMDAFRGFTDSALYSAWMGVEVSIEDERFATTLEWGTTIRGHYDHVVAPRFIALRWDFEDENIPVPGSEVRGYMHFVEIEPSGIEPVGMIDPTAAPGSGCRVEVLQFVDTAEQAAFMEVAWTMVLGRFREGIVDALAAAEPGRRRRPARRKRG